MRTVTRGLDTVDFIYIGGQARFDPERKNLFVFGSDDGNDIIPAGEIDLANDKIEVPLKAEVKVEASGSSDTLLKIDRTTVLIQGVQGIRLDDVNIARVGDASTSGTSTARLDIFLCGLLVMLHQILF